MKRFVFIAAFFLLVHFSSAQGNIYLDGENYIAIKNTAFDEKTNWTGFSNGVTIQTPQNPVVTYWFTDHGRSHIVIHLKNGRSSIFMELSRNKNTYHFPTDINSSDFNNPDYHFNDFLLYVQDKSGIVRQFAFGKDAHTNIQVQQLDPSHLKIKFDGTIDYYPHPGRYDLGPLSLPMPIEGSISLSKKSPELEHLTESYSGCNNTIYDEVSPGWKGLGNWRSATQCEESFYKKMFAAMNNAMQPVYDYFKSQGWILLDRTVYTPLDVRLKGVHKGLFAREQGGYEYILSFTANPMKGAYNELQQKISQFNQTHQMMKDGHLDTPMVKQTMQYREEGKDFGFKIKIVVNQKLETSNYPVEINEIPLEKLPGYSFVIKKVISKDWEMPMDYDTYLLLGNWQPPQWQTHQIIAQPFPPMNAKELSIQSVYIDLDCGNNLVASVLNHINFEPLQQLLKITP